MLWRFESLDMNLSYPPFAKTFLDPFYVSNRLVNVWTRAFNVDRTSEWDIDICTTIKGMVPGTVSKVSLRKHAKDPKTVIAMETSAVKCDRQAHCCKGRVRGTSTQKIPHAQPLSPYCACQPGRGRFKGAKVSIRCDKLKPVVAFRSRLH